MSTPEQPDTPPLTRRQLRDIRNTGATPIIEMPVEAYPEHATDEADTRAPAPQPVYAEPVAVSDSRPRAAAPVVVPPAPAPDASVDLGVSPLTRRQARQQERIRTASVPVITPEYAARFVAESAAAEAAHPVEVPQPAEATRPTEVAQPARSAAAVPVATVHAEPESADEQPIRVIATGEPQDADVERPVLNAGFGAELLAGEPPRAELPGSFDELITRDSSSAGSVATPNALILSQVPSAGPLTGPIASTGEVLITGSYDLPEGLGSTGHAAGTADGKEVDAVLVDGELPAHSSPTPISASAAISTVKTDGEIIRPPAPEKGSRLMLALAITAGVLFLALVGVVIVALVTGAFS